MNCLDPDIRCKFVMRRVLPDLYIYRSLVGPRGARAGRMEPSSHRKCQRELGNCTIESHRFVGKGPRNYLSSAHRSAVDDPSTLFGYAALIAKASHLEVNEYSCRPSPADYAGAAQLANDRSIYFVVDSVLADLW
jgi:hypothetical protein